jgi:CspA family cold shock protein
MREPAIPPGRAFPPIRIAKIHPAARQGRRPSVRAFMTQGTVKFFNAAKGFGFITPDGGGKDVFVPAASVTASGISNLKAGQRVSFDTEPDAKGPKAVNLKLVADAPQAARPAPAPQPRAAEPSRITLFHDPASEESHTVLAALAAAGHEPQLVDYIAAPPDRDVLKNLALLLRGGDQSLVRKYDPLFLELRLDDRFISDGEFWAGIVEHPTLINGPVLATAHKARVCRTGNAVKSFLGIDASDDIAAKPKGLPQSLAGATTDGIAPARNGQDVAKAEPKPVEKARPNPSKKSKTLAKAKTELKAKKTATKSTPKPVKKAGRAK